MSKQSYTILYCLSDTIAYVSCVFPHLNYDAVQSITAHVVSEFLEYPYKQKDLEETISKMHQLDLESVCNMIDNITQWMGDTLSLPEQITPHNSRRTFVWVSTTSIALKVIPESFVTQEDMLADPFGIY